jgi:hypothetical protein
MLYCVSSYLAGTIFRITCLLVMGDNNHLLDVLGQETFAQESETSKNVAFDNWLMKSVISIRNSDWLPIYIKNSHSHAPQICHSHVPDEEGNNRKHNNDDTHHQHIHKQVGREWSSVICIITALLTHALNLRSHHS